MSPRHVERDLVCDDAAASVEQLESDGHLDGAVGEKEDDSGFRVVIEDGAVVGRQPHGGDLIAREEFAASTEAISAPPAGQVDPRMVSVRRVAASAGTASGDPTSVGLVNADQPSPLSRGRLLVFKGDQVEAAVSDRALLQFRQRMLSCRAVNGWPRTIAGVGRGSVGVGVGVGSSAAGAASSAMMASHGSR